jgi:pimeloyl-ACP methyl ester carboxylesterase
MPDARAHDGNVIEIEVHGEGPTLLLPVNPRPIEGPQAEQMRQFDADPALGLNLIKGLSDAFRVVAFDYEGHVFRAPKPETLTPVNVATDVLAVADAVKADRFAYYGYSWLAVVGLQLAIQTDRLSALIMGGWPPLNAPYPEMLRVTEASVAMSAAQSMPKSTESETPDEESQWSSTALSVDQARQFLTLYQALQGFDDRAAQTRINCPRLCFVGSADEMQYPAQWGNVHVSIAGPIIAGRAELERFGWDVQVLDGLDHIQAMQASQVVPILRSWLDSKLAHY